MFNNPCLGHLDYEATTSAILMAGIFLTFLIEYLGHRFAHRNDNKSSKKTDESSNESTTGDLVNASLDSKDPEIASTHSYTDVIGVTVLEAGIVFHSLRKRDFVLELLCC